MTGKLVVDFLFVLILTFFR